MIMDHGHYSWLKLAWYPTIGTLSCAIKYDVMYMCSPQPDLTDLSLTSVQLDTQDRTVQ